MDTIVVQSHGTQNSFATVVSGTGGIHWIKVYVVLTVVSSPPDKSRLPSLENESAFTHPPWPSNTESRSKDCDRRAKWSRLRFSGRRSERSWAFLIRFMREYRPAGMPEEEVV